jgi:glycosyltransferase involved in cell wall biosynthesis
LSCDRDDIEVVVTDNDSQDNTLELLNTITDSRFHYFKNKTNLGGITNLIRSLMPAKGKYAFYSNDRDYIIVENIPNLCDFLYHNEYSYIHCCGKTVVFKDKRKAFSEICVGHHPTGMIFRTEHLACIENLEWFAKEENVGDYPYAFLAGRLCLMGNTALVKNIYWKMAENDFLYKTKSFYSFGKPMEKLFFYPMERLHFLEKIGNYLVRLNYFTPSETKKILFRHYLVAAQRAVFEFQFFMTSASVLHHYNLEYKKYGIMELYHIYLMFYRGYKKSYIFRYYSLSYRLLFFFLQFWELPKIWMFAGPFRVFFLSLMGILLQIKKMFSLRDFHSTQ